MIENMMTSCIYNFICIGNRCVEIARMRDKDEATTSNRVDGTCKELALQAVRSGDRAHRPMKRIIGQQVSKIYT